MAVSHSQALRDGIADFVGSEFDGGSLVFLTAQGREVASIALADLAFGRGSADGVVTANPPPARGVSRDGGIIARAELRSRDASVRIACSVSTIGAGGNIEIEALVLKPGQSIELENLDYIAPP